jgi:glyoxylase-like metal-dependent hydrolase (beta-lactamase superfamily II)
MKVYILDNGFLECDQNWMVAMAVLGTKDNPNPRINWIKIPVFAVLIDHPDGKILYDTGCHPDAMNGYWPTGLQALFPYYHHESQNLINQLALVNTKPNDIKTVVLSHMHLDHAGNLCLFPHADVYVHKKDFEFGQTLVHISPNPDDHGAYIKADMEVAAKRFHLVDKDQELADGITMIMLPGHTPGVIGLVVELKNEGTLIFPQDAIYTRANFGPPAKASGIVHDSLAFFASIEKVRELSKKHNGKVIFSHDMEFFQTLKLAPDYYD